MKESRWMRWCVRVITRHLLLFVLCVGAIAVGFAYVTRYELFNNKGKTNTSSVLTGVIDIAELSAAEFKYRGIADIYTDESRTQLHCRVCYNAIVKAGIDMKKVQFNVDEEKRVVIATLPDIELKVTIIDQQSMTLMPSDADVEIDRILRYSKEDVENEARESTELISTAQENLKRTIEGLLFPILKVQGITIMWN